MPRLIVTPGATRGLERCRQFLADKNPAAGRRAAEAIKKHFELVTRHPGIGRPLDEEPQWRELIISFGDSGYTALYHHEEETDTVLILAFRHQKAAGY